MSSERSFSAVARVALVAALAHGAACADFSRGDPLGPTGGGAPDASGSASGSAFDPDIHALLLDGCASCHSPTGAASDTELLLTGNLTDDYSSTSALVDLGSPDASRLVVKMEGRGHAGGAIYTRASPEYARVLRWIGEGAAP
jgi:hypothetical protein